MTIKGTQLLIDETIEDIALVLAGIFAEHGVRDEVIWQSMKHLDISREQALARLDDAASAAGRPKPSGQTRLHPAVEALIVKLRLDRPFQPEF
jgi:hypothetical protein